MTATLLTPNPEALAEQIQQVVQTRTGGRVRGLRVQVVDRYVIVSGQTSTYYNKQLVTHAAMEAADDALVQNDVEVR